MNILGPQCLDDDPFKKLARRHQSAYRADVLKVPFDGHGNILQAADAAKGLNFYDGYDIFRAVTERRPRYAKPLYANLLRSEHIPYNVFVPFRRERALFIAIAQEAFGLGLSEVGRIDIEYAPQPESNYLGDNTSFDVFCDCRDSRGESVFLGIEVKYTEKGYAIGAKERECCSNLNSPYHLITKSSGLYQAGVLEELKTDRFRQLWRNHLLAESLRRKSAYRDYRSIVLYPSGNRHMADAVVKYATFLHPTRAQTFLAGTFETLFALLRAKAKSIEVIRWCDYLTRRYIPGTT